MVVDDLKARFESGQPFELATANSGPEILEILLLYFGAPPAAISNRRPPETRARLLAKAAQARRENRKLYSVSLLRMPRELAITGDPRYEDDVEHLSLELLDTVDQAIQYITDLGYPIESLVMASQVL